MKVLQFYNLHEESRLTTHCSSPWRVLVLAVGREVEMDSKFEERKKEAFWGLFVADALAMPVHWYYRIADIPAGYGGWITGYRAPNEEHPHNFMSPSGISEFVYLPFVICICVRRPASVHLTTRHPR